MKVFTENIWQENEYNYAAAYGFMPNIHAYIHDEEDASGKESDADRDCMLIAPGGGYCMCVAHEGEHVAKVFYEQGMNVFVLSYTTDITMSVPLKKQPLEDISRAVRYIRKRADQYHIKDKKLIICGFSAGAHVCGSLAVHFADVEDKSPEYKDISNRPDGAILSYPVITCGEKTHIYSVQTLLGYEPTDEELEYFSLEKNVTENTPPCFLWQTATDELVPVENSYMMAEALKEKGVMFAHYVFPSGFHGLSYPNDEFFQGLAGGQYTFDQLEKAVKAVKAGKGVNVSETRKKELEEQFPDIKPYEESVSEGQSQETEAADQEKSEDQPQGLPPIDKTWIEDIGLWPELARVWMNRI